MHANGLVSFTVLIVSTIMKRRSMNPKNGLQASSPMAEIQNPVDQQRAHKRTRTNSQILPFPSPTKERQKEPKNEIIISDIIELAKIAPRTRSGWLVGDGLTHLVGVEPRFEIIAHQFGIPGALNGKNEIDKAVPVDQNGKLQPFHALARTIIYQQLAGNAAAAIFERVLKILLKGDESSHRILMPHHVLQTDIKVDVVDGKKRVLLNGELSGLSVSKSQYLVSLAEHYSDPTLLKDVDLDALSDADLFAKLTAVKGLGNLPPYNTPTQKPMHILRIHAFYDLS